MGCVKWRETTIMISYLEIAWNKLKYLPPRLLWYTFLMQIHTCNYSKDNKIN